MSWKFNPPPGWPAQPEGWQPPPGWTPDPSWPPAPPGWQFWVPADAPPAGSGQGGQAQAGSPQAGHPQAGAAAGGASPTDSSVASSNEPTVHEQPTTFANFAGAQPGSPAPQPGASAAPQPGSPAGQPSGPPAGQPSGPPAAAPGQPAAGQPPAGQPPIGQPMAAPAMPPSGAPAGSPYSPQYAASAPPGPYVPVQPPAEKPWHSRWWAVTGIALTVLLVGCLGGTAVALVTDNTDDPGPNTQEPPPAPTAQPSDEPAGGTGDLAVGEERTGDTPTIITLDLPEDDRHMVTVSFTGNGFFQASLVDRQGELMEYLVGANEDFTGTYPVDVGLFRSEPVSGIDISSSDGGSWSVLVQPLTEAPLWPDETEGSGDTVLQVDQSQLSGETEVTATHDGESNFIVWAYGTEDFGHSSLYNEIGVVPNPDEDIDGDGDDVINEDAIMIAVQADGGWTIEPA